MSLYKRYTAKFRDLYQVLYDVEIWQESGKAFVIEEIQLAREAVTIEWAKLDKLVPIRSSAATLKVLCHEDRKFTDLYTTSIKSIRLDIYRNGSLYWSGTIDTELYEEPYYTPKGYVVTLTFSDFSVLDRIKYQETGFILLKDLLDKLVFETGINTGGVITHLSTKMGHIDFVGILDGINLLSENFYDEDGEANTLKDVLEYILTPLTAHIQQKNGNIHVFDINQIVTEETKPVKWVRKDSILGFDKIYNNVNLTFSPYDVADLIKSEIPEDDFPVDSQMTNTVVRVNYENLGTSSEQPIGFTIYIAAERGDNVYTLTDPTARYFNIQSVYSGEPSRGVAWTIFPRDISFVNAAISCFSEGNPNGTHVKGEMFRLKKQPYIGYYSTNDYLLKISLDFLFDVRYNPFEQAGKYNEQGNWDKLQSWSNYAYVPVMITLRDRDGIAKYHYVNNSVFNHIGYNVEGKWVKGESTWGDAYLCYYDVNDRYKASGLGGWQTNRQITGVWGDDFPEAITRRGTGEYIPLPPAAGWLDIRVGVGIIQHNQYINWTEEDIYSLTRWVLYKDLSVEIVDKYGKSVNLTDQVHTAWMDKNAAEKYELTTHIGTSSACSPAARGLMFMAYSDGIVTELHRNGITAGVEELAIGTIYSQFASRKNKLTGTVMIVPEFTVLSDNNTLGKFMLTYEYQNLSAATSDISMVEIEADNYEGVEFTDNGA
ncbi:hypothetical protein [Parabacteroides sp. AM08-6]|uniref:hypothetical protein n=1 Tax=Parabacteroides sp. AM08-6 TaxID=2292053 RepID=UPI000F00E1E6|nr:hypothetical protein [Parabacteroides sp. AM08-6]RHJ76218.1 hypothetical protein DW103_17065 [Parabacteroides sp. AM08-6]